MPQIEILGVTKWGWVGHGVSYSLQRDISLASIYKYGETVRVIASRSHPGDVFSVTETSLKGYKKVQKWLQLVLDTRLCR